MYYGSNCLFKIIVFKLVIILQAIGIKDDSFEIELESNRIYLKFIYQDFDEVGSFLRKDFTFRTGEFSFNIDIGKK